MILYFLRHADAEDSAPSDFERKLTPKGIGQADKVGKFLLRHGIEPEVILSSPVVRAKHTAESVAKSLGMDIALEECIACGMRTATLLQRLAAHKGCASLLLVGHEPDFSTTIGDLIGIRDPGALLIQKASLTAIDTPWLEEGAGQLVFSIPVRLM
jgi:phosphohistidine phosphatase